MGYSYRIEQAIRAAAVLHKDQVRRGSTPYPYITHLYAVALITSDYTDNEDTIIAALLHDTLEDTDYTPDELQDDFGGNVKELVLSVTEPEPAEGEENSWKEKKGRYLKQLKNAPEGSLIVAAADKIHNMRSVVEEYYDNHSKFIADFGGSLNERLMMYQEISNTLNRRLSNDIIHEFNHVFDEYKKFISHVQKQKERL
jgi:(p)ppGpp synthase/HD superfamily hydrolase